MEEYSLRNLLGGKVMYRVLIVEDDAVIADAIRQALSRWGLEAYVAEDFSDIYFALSNKRHPI